MWHTEGCNSFTPYNELEWLRDAELYLMDFIGNVNAGMNGYIDWNLLLDFHGGPYHADNFCKSPVILNETNTDFILTPIYYYLAHIAKFVAEGSMSLHVDVYRPDLFVCAFRTDKQVVTIALNLNGYDIEIDLVLEQKRTHDLIMAHSIVTYVSESVSC